MWNKVKTKATAILVLLFLILVIAKVYEVVTYDSNLESIKKGDHYYQDNSNSKIHLN